MYIKILYLTSCLKLKRSQDVCFYRCIVHKEFFCNLTSISWRSILISPSGIKVIYILKSMIILREKLCIMDQKKAWGDPFQGWEVYSRDGNRIMLMRLCSPLMTPQQKSKYPRIAGVHG